MLTIIVLKFITPRYTLLLSYSEIYKHMLSIMNEVDLFNFPLRTFIFLSVHVSQLHSLVDYLPLGGRRRSFTLRASVSSLITHHVLPLYLHLSSLNLCHLISAVNVILFGLRLFINSVICLCSYSTH